MLITGRNKKWSDLTACQKGPFILGVIVQFAPLAVELLHNIRRSAEEIEGRGWQRAAAANSMSTGPIACLGYGRRR